MTTAQPTAPPAEGSASPPTPGAERAAAGTSSGVDLLGWVTGLVRGDRPDHARLLALGGSAELLASS